MKLAAITPPKIDNLVNLNLHAAAIGRMLEGYLKALENQTSLSGWKEAEKLPEPPALAELCSVFNLSSFDRHILLLCLAMELEPSLGRICASIHGDERLTYPTPYLAYNIFPDAVWSAFTPESPLSSWQLIEIKTDLVFTLSSLKIDRTILFYLFGEPYSDPQLKDIIEPVIIDEDENFSLSASQRHIAEEIVKIWSTEVYTDLPIIQLCGNDKRTKIDIATAAASAVGINLNRVSIPNLAYNLTESPNSLGINFLMQRWKRASLLTNSLLLVDCDEVKSAEPTQVGVLNQLLENLNSPAIFTSRKRLDSPNRPVITFDVPSLTHNEQRNLWYFYLGETAASLNGQIDSLVSQFNLTSQAIQSVCNQTLASNSTTADLGSKLWDTCRTQGRQSMDSLAVRIETSMTLDDLVFPESTKNILKEICAQVRYRTQVYTQWGMAPKHDREKGISVLFWGESGLGKTTAAEVIAKELHVDIYRVDLSAVVSKYIGETEKNLAVIFDAAEAGGFVLLLDEADAIVGKRGDVKEARDRYANQEVSYLLQRMETYRGLAILTTNKKDAIDSAFQRRLRFIVEFPFPSDKERSELWQRAFPPQTPTENLDIELLTQLRANGANIRNIALAAAFMAAENNETVQMKHILIAAKREAKKEGRTLAACEIKGWQLNP